MSSDVAEDGGREFGDGTVLNTDEDQLFLVEDNQLRPIVEPMSVYARGIDPETIRNVPVGDLTGIVLGPRVEPPKVVEKNLHSDLGGRKYMTTTAKLSKEDGVLEITTRTYTGKHWEGFTGGVQIYVVGPDGIRRAKTQWFKYGVNGKKMSGEHDRTETQIVTINQEIAKNAKDIIIAHAHKPEIQKRLDEFYENTEKAADLIAKGVSIGASISGAS